MQQLVLQPLVHQLVQALAEDVGLPDLDGVLLKVLEQAHHQLLALTLGAHDGRNFGIDGGLEQMDGRRAGPQANSVAPALAHDLRLFQMQLVQRGHHDAVAGGLHLLDGAADLLVLPLGPGKADDAGHQACLVADLQPRGLPQHPVEDVRLQFQLQNHLAGGQLHAAHPGALEVFALQRGSLGHVLHLADRSGILLRRRVHRALQPVIRLQHGDPPRHCKGDFLYIKLIEHALQDTVDGGAVQVHAVHRQHGVAVFFLHLLRQLAGGRAVRVQAVEQDDEGLVDLGQLGNDPGLGVPVLFPGNVADGAVGGDDQADGGVVPDDLAGAGLGGHVEGDLLLEPGALDHAGLLVLLVAHGSLHHVTHAVDEAGVEAAAALQFHRHRRFGDEFGLGGHNGAPCCRLGQFVPGAGLDRGHREPREDEFFHEFLHKGALAGAHRAHHADVDVAAGAGGNVLVYAAAFHTPASFQTVMGTSSRAGAVSCRSSRWFSFIMAAGGT